MAYYDHGYGCPSVRPRVVGPFDVLFKYASGPTPCGCPVAHPSSRSRDGNSSNMRARPHYSQITIRMRKRLRKPMTMTWTCHRKRVAESVKRPRLRRGIGVARTRRWVCNRATAGSWTRGALEQYVAGSDTRGRTEGHPYPWS